MRGAIMYLRKYLPVNNRKREACCYQPYFDLRRNIAKVIANYAIGAVQKNILLDIFVDHETPNYFQGDLTGLLGLLSELFKHCIESLEEGEICIRINHESPHKNNNCETELSIIITTHNATGTKNLPQVDQFSQLCNDSDKNEALKSYATYLRIQHLCSYFSGNIKKQKLDDRKTQYTVSLILQQADSTRMLYLA